MVKTRSLVAWFLICLLITSVILVPYASGAENSLTGQHDSCACNETAQNADSVTDAKASLSPEDTVDHAGTKNTGEDGQQALAIDGGHTEETREIPPLPITTIEPNGNSGTVMSATTTPDTTTKDTAKADTTETLIAKYSTALINSPPNRTYNIGLALNMLNGYIVGPGKVFSFNKVVGPRTKKRGYKTAMVIVNRRFVPGIGGGVCQVASTLYNVVINAGFKVVERYPHSLKVGYVPQGRDAAVSYGVQDLKFVNTLGFPVMIKAEKTEHEVKIEFHRWLPSNEIVSPGKY